MNLISTAFADAVHDSQFCFRRLLKAMSEPGTRITLDRSQGFGTMPPAAVQVLLTLGDSQTPVWLSPKLNDKPVTDNIAFHIGATVTHQLADAVFAVVGAEDLTYIAARFAECYPGNEEYPDQGTTLVIETDSFATGPELTLNGPGIPGTRQVQLGNLDDEILSQLQNNGSRFPMGLDLIFVAGEEVIAIPRSTTVEV